MPLFFSAQLDDEPRLDAVPRWKGGQNSNEPVSALKIEEYARGINLDMPTLATLDTRRGTLRVGAALADKVQGLIWYDHIEGSSRVRELFAFANGAGAVYDGASWAAQTPTVTNATAQVQMAQFADQIYYVDGTSNVFSWDGTTDTDLGGGGAANPPVGPSMITTVQNRLVVAGMAADPTVLHFSDVLSTVWDSTNNVVYVGKGENAPITCLQSWNDFTLVVFKQTSTWIVTCNEAAVADFTIKRLHETVGCVGPRASVQVGNDIWFLGTTGIHSVKRDVSGLNQEVTVPVSTAIQDIIDRINWGSASKSCATFFDNRVMFAVPIDGATSPNVVLVYSTLAQTWLGYWTGWEPTCFAITGFNDTQDLVFGRTDGEVRRWLTNQSEGSDTTFKDQGSDIFTTLLSRGMICGEAFNPKQPFWAEWEWFDSEANCRLSLVPDGTSAYQVAEVSTRNPVLTLPFTLPATLLPNGVKRVKKHIQHRPPFREMQLQMETSSGKVRHRAAFLSAFVDTFDLHTA